jgi:hypothetical protein
MLAILESESERTHEGRGKGPGQSVVNEKLKARPDSAKSQLN